MKKFALLTMAAALLFAACDDNDNSKPQNEKETAVDFNKFCNIVMGKACGANISEADMNSCVETYKAEAKKYEATCKDVSEQYYKCVSNATIKECTDKDNCECIDDDVCKTEIDAYSACMGEPEEEEIDFNKFCNVVMGKACGANISEADMNSCVETYKAEAKKYEATCKDVGEKYYKCVSNATIKECTDKDNCECIDDDVCKTEVEAYSACMKSDKT